MNTKELIEAIAPDWGEFIRIGTTADGDWFVQLVEVGDEEDVTAKGEGGLDDALREVLAQREAER